MAVLGPAGSRAPRRPGAGAPRRLPGPFAAPPAGRPDAHAGRGRRICGCAPRAAVSSEGACRCGARAWRPPRARRPAPAAPLRSPDGAAHAWRWGRAGCPRPPRQAGAPARAPPHPSRAGASRARRPGRRCPRPQSVRALWQLCGGQGWHGGSCGRAAAPAARRCGPGGAPQSPGPGSTGRARSPPPAHRWGRCRARGWPPG